MKNLIKIRFLQLYRELVKAGWWASFVGMMMCLVIIMKILKSDGQNIESYLILMTMSFGVFGIQSIRKDKRTLTVIFPNIYKIYYFLEYFIFSLLFVIPYIFIKGFLGIILFWASCFLITQIDISLKPFGKIKTILLSKSIEKDNFEWISGMRNIQFPMIIIYLFCLVLSYWHFAGFICLGVITFLFSSCYNECESQFVLTLKDSNSKDFVKKKLKKHLTQYVKFNLPILLVYFIHYPDKWIFYVPLMIVYVANYVVYILNKYKSYMPNQILQSNVVIVGLTSAGMFIPYLFPISLILVFVFYPKAIHNLKTYFHA
jgi:hypothetical protein